MALNQPFHLSKNKPVRGREKCQLKLLLLSLERQLENLSPESPPSRHLPSLQMPPPHPSSRPDTLSDMRGTGSRPVPFWFPTPTTEPPFDLVSTVELQARHNRRTGYCFLSGQKMILIGYPGTMPGTNSHRSPEPSLHEFPLPPWTWLTQLPADPSQARLPPSWA